MPLISKIYLRLLTCRWEEVPAALEWRGKTFGGRMDDVFARFILAASPSLAGNETWPARHRLLHQLNDPKRRNKKKGGERMG